MSNGVRLFLIATRYGIIEHARNRFAMVLVAAFVPILITLARVAVTDIEVPFRLRDTGLVLRANGNQLAQISAAIMGVTLIIGFMMFAATFSSGAFDRRLSMAGYPRVALALAKIACLVVASLVVCSYATAVICCYWSPRQPVLLAAALFGAAMTYGALGVALGALLRREVEGMFAIAMISCVDMAVQNPIASVGADSELVRWLPSYGAMQASTAAGFSDATPFAGFAVQLAWFAASALAGLVAFHLRTRSSLRPRMWIRLRGPHILGPRITGPTETGQPAKQ
ncbi:ABC transporter permease [Nocardia araoensis]|uniref:ABC transporter permease n=1 Tax=Nocardia araoensis TaxID=228600 RepID=UPI0002E65449|nr:ABC transporter permease [Nocardia araoensis]